MLKHFLFFLFLLNSFLFAQNLEIITKDEILFVLGTTALLHSNDPGLYGGVQKNRSAASDDLAENANKLGDIKYVLPALGLYYSYGYFIQDSEIKRITWLSCESLIYTGLIVGSLKLAVQRYRPEEDDPYPDSFPSGHSAVAFSLATVMATEYADNPIVPPVAYSLAALTAWARVNDQRHWASDVFFGGALGYFTAKAVINHHDHRNNDFSIFPIFNKEQTGLALSWKF